MRGLTLVALIMSFLSSGFNTEKMDEVNYYAQTMVVTEVNYEEDVVTCATFTGYEWSFTECDDWYEGDVCSMIMCDNGTLEIEDDFIVDIKYSGWVNEWGYEYGTSKPLYTFDI